MTEVSEFRSLKFFKGGECLTNPKGKEVFTALDAGDATLGAVATDICMDCTRLPKCRSRAYDSSGNLVRRAGRHGIGYTVVGTVELINKLATKRSSSEGETKHVRSNRNKVRRQYDTVPAWAKKQIKACFPDDTEQMNHVLLEQLNRGVVKVADGKLVFGNALAVLSPQSRLLTVWYYGLDEVMFGEPVDARVFRLEDPAGHFTEVIKPLIEVSMTAS